MVATIDPQIIARVGEARIIERIDSALLEEGMQIVAPLTNILFENQNPEPVLGIGGDYVPNTQLYSAVSVLYPALYKDEKSRVVSGFLSIFDNLNYAYVQNNHTPCLADPFLLSDIVVLRRVYWPGIDEAEPLVSKVRSLTDFNEFKDKHMTSDGLFNQAGIQNDFLLAYALLRSDMSKQAKEFASACHHDFLERVIDGIVTMRFGRAKSPEEFAAGRVRLKILLPDEVQAIIDRKVEEECWKR